MFDSRYDYYFNDWFKRPALLPCYDNIYHRTAKQFKKKLESFGLNIDSVSGVSIGDINYYHVECNYSPCDEQQFNMERIIREDLGIKGVGLADYYQRDGWTHKIILVNEEELNDKYLVDGNLVFEEEFNLLDNLDKCAIEKQLARNDIKANVVTSMKYHGDYDGIILIKDTRICAMSIADALNIPHDAVIDISVEKTDIDHIILLDRVKEC